MDISDYGNALAFIPDEGGYIVFSGSAAIGQVRIVNTTFEYESFKEKERGVWIPCGKSIQDVKTFIVRNP